MRYSHQAIEQKWQAFWLQNRTFTPQLEDLPLRKYYVLDMFPYPSGKGLHVGHLRGYVATDVIARWKRMENYTVFHPIGFDSFGLPAEQYAMQTGQDPQRFTDHNIANFLKQLKALGFAYDYQRVLKTSDPQYYRWTQWIFQQFFTQRLAYKAAVPVNFCPALNTVLANEEIVPTADGTMVSERGQHPVYRRLTSQWLLDIVKFAPLLLATLPALNWPSTIKRAQTQWIGATAGYYYQARVKTTQKLSKPVYLSVFTTQLCDWSETTHVLIDFNQTTLDYCLSPPKRAALADYRARLAKQPLHNLNAPTFRPLVFPTGCRIWNPIQKIFLPVAFTNALEPEIPFQVLLLTARDIRLKKILRKANGLFSIAPQKSSLHVHIANPVFRARHLRIKFQAFTHYRLRNWVFSRQRYWGEPFPLYKVPSGWKILPVTKLPLRLPAFSAVNFNSAALAPLGSVKAWVKAKYDHNVMPQWAGSSWYFLAYLLVKPDRTLYPLNSQLAKQILNHWMPVDLYIGGQEHAVSHLLYARFWNQFLVRNCQIYNHLEPFKTLLNQGLILGSDQKKMSKSRGNVVDPMTYLVSHGADALRLYIQFLGPFSAKIAWNEDNLDAMRKWLARVYNLYITHKNRWKPDNDHQLDHLMHKTIKTVTVCYQTQQFNVAIAALMTFVNACYKLSTLYLEYGKQFLQLLHPLCPHLTAELWVLWELKPHIFDTQWPTYDVTKLQTPTTVYALQINGKTKKTFPFPYNARQAAVLRYCTSQYLHLLPPAYQTIIFVPDKVINFVKK